MLLRNACLLFLLLITLRTSTVSADRREPYRAGYPNDPIKNAQCQLAIRYLTGMDSVTSLVKVAVALYNEADDEFILKSLCGNRTFYPEIKHAQACGKWVADIGTLGVVSQLLQFQTIFLDNSLNTRRTLAEKEAIKTITVAVVLFLRDWSACFSETKYLPQEVNHLMECGYTSTRLVQAHISYHDLIMGFALPEGFK